MKHFEGDDLYFPEPCLSFGPPSHQDIPIHSMSQMTLYQAPAPHPERAAHVKQLPES